MLSSATAALSPAAAGVRIGDDRLYLKAEHLQKTVLQPRGDRPHGPPAG
jgi:hypothetical protein